MGKSVLDNMDPSDSKLPLHKDIMQLARLGEVGPVQKLFEDGTYNATYTDAENITPLHVRLNSALLNRMFVPSAET